MLASVSGTDPNPGRTLLYDRNVGEVTLQPRGIRVGLECRHMRTAMEAGVMPQPISEEVRAAVLKKANEGIPQEQIAADVGEELAPEEKADWEARAREFVAGCITSIDGEPAELTGADTYQFNDAEFFTLQDYCTRTKPLPGKE